MPASDTSAVIAALEPSDRSTSPKNPAAEKLAAPTDSNVGPSKGRKPAWNVPSGTASSESVGPFMGGATWPALGPATSSRASPKSTSTASSSSTDSLKSLSDGSAVSAPVVRNYNSSSETVMVPVPPPQQKPNPTPNLTRRASTGSESTHNPQPNNRSSRWGNGPNRRGNNNNNHYNNNNNGGGYRGRERVGANWNPSWNNNSPRPPNFYRGNQAMNTPPPPPPPVSYAYAAPTVHQPFYAPMGYGYPYMFGNVPVIAPQLVPQMAPPVLYSARELEQRDAILKQIEYYFSTENLCKDIYLRKNMDAEGWVPISFIANFNRVKQLTNNLQLIRDTLNNSTVVEVQGDRIRKHENWMVWILPPARQLENVAIPIQGLTIGPGTGTSSHNI